MKIQNGISLVPPSAEAKLSERDIQLKNAAKMYETHFLNEMVKAMRSTVGHEDGVVKQNFAEKIFTEQLDNQYVEGWAKKGGVGLADMIYTQIRDKYFGSGVKNIPGLEKKMLPIAPQKDLKGIPSTDSIQMKTIPSENPKSVGYRFEVPDAVGGFEAQVPLPGKLAAIERLDQGWNQVTLDHGGGLRSQMTFPGQVTDSSLGKQFTAGQKLGILDSSRPVLAWNLEWS